MLFYELLDLTDSDLFEFLDKKYVFVQVSIYFNVLDVDCFYFGNIKQ